MQYRRLGTSGLKLSAISLGSWLITRGTEAEQAQQAVRRAYELGVNHFDSAANYGRRPHDSEEALGAILREFPRHTYTVTSKMFWPVGPSTNERGLSRKTIFDQVHLSLKALQMEYIDLFYCHRFDPDTDLEETLRALDDLITQGKILYWGISDWTAAQIERAMAIVDRRNLHRPVAHQPEYNLLAPGIEAEVLPATARAGMGTIAYSPLAMGLLSGKYKPNEAPPAGSRPTFVSFFNKNQLTWEKVQRLLPVAEGLGLTLPQMALAWVLRRPELTSACIGASRPEQVEQNVRAVDVVLPPEVLAEIEAIVR
ncbi:MAG: putative potassium channel beta subunit [Symbiobacteriaceae bacterium]|jgi:aryl-alcohol dehydrogenase-like predicted oxidoreductase|nr:putative potassium channel beta subunit [Symbiobacteriaceae bacterium]